MNFKITKPVRLLETFSGIGSQAMALRDLGVNFEHWRTMEWDVNSVKSYHAIHMMNDNKDYSAKFSKEQLINILEDIGISSDGKTPMMKDKIKKKNERWLRDTFNDFMATKNIGSVMNRKGKDLKIVDTDKYCYILTYSFPCQDLSLSGLQKGMSKGSGTRSGLLWEIERLLNECAELGELPQVLLMENVTQLHSKKNIADFEQWIKALENLGYSNFYQDMNSKNYGVAQNRDRCFMVSILKSEFGENATYTFPEPIPLQKRLKDYLEDEVDEKYYINTDRAKELIGKLIDKGVLPKEKNTPVDLATRNPDTRDVANCVKTVQRGIVNFAQAETGVATYNG